MQHTLILTSDPNAPALGPEIASAAQSALATVSAETGDIGWLAPEIACEIPFSGSEARADVLNRTRDAIGDSPVDVNIVLSEGRAKRLLVADMDSTMITSETLDDLAEFCGLKDTIAPITARAMRGEIGFEDALRERVAMLKGFPASLLDRLLAERIELTSGSGTLVATMRANGAYAALVSGGFTFCTSHVRQLLGFDEDRSNTLLLEGDKLLGKVLEPILGQDAKVTALNELAGQIGATPADALTVGDGANDMAMLKAAGLGVAFRAKPAVAAAAAHRIDHGDLTALLYLQGYSQTSFAPI
ncbi:MAG: phosphoserine phosphatase SerB [Rhodospirillaceae bacterium]|jgi:phosphoserine phosphatase|nr:phosphoserine phosphatase SerB [Rhodospirillaceae bacterium]MBT6139391.1 phosphoserine phosphatase SerB [Rhodospirillaceae bacterium]